MALTNLVDELTQGVHKLNCKNYNMGCIEYTNVKDNLIEYKCLCCNKNYQIRFDENLKKRFTHIYRFNSHDCCSRKVF